jgi:pimeloyl-ACP methyl ester carboxylesterase
MLTAFADGTIVGERYGSGEIEVVALHGWQRTHADFAPALSHSARGAAALDLPGFGGTAAPSGPWGSRAYAEALVPVLESIGRPVVVVGHSYGGRVALQLAVIAPDLVRALVLSGVPQMAPPTRRSRPNRKFQLIRLARRLGLVGERRLEAARDKHGSRDYREAQGVLRGVLVTALGERYDDLLPQITCPVELVWGELDSAAPVADARYADSVLRYSNLVVVEGVGHMVPTDEPQALVAAIDRVTA